MASGKGLVGVEPRTDYNTCTIANTTTDSPVFDTVASRLTAFQAPAVLTAALTWSLYASLDQGVTYGPINNSAGTQIYGGYSSATLQGKLIVIDPKDTASLRLYKWHTSGAVGADMVFGMGTTYMPSAGV